MEEIILSDQEKQTLLHTLGLSNITVFEKDKINNPYRNNFYTSENSDDYQHIKLLILKGLMIDTQKGWPGQDSHYFIATDKGIELAKVIALESIPKLSRSKMRYQAYLHSECDDLYGDWLKNKYWDDYRKRYGVS